MMFCRNCVCCQRLWPLRSALVWSRACVAQSTCLASQWSTNLRWQLWLAVDSSDRWFDPGCWLGSGFQSQLEQLVSSLFQNPISFGRLTEAKYYHCFLLGLRANNFNPILIFPQCVCVCVSVWVSCYHIAINNFTWSFSQDAREEIKRSCAPTSHPACKKSINAVTKEY